MVLFVSIFALILDLQLEPLGRATSQDIRSLGKKGGSEPGEREALESFCGFYEGLSEGSLACPAGPWISRIAWHSSIWARDVLIWPPGCHFVPRPALIASKRTANGFSFEQMRLWLWFSSLFIFCADTQLWFTVGCTCMGMASTFVQCFGCTPEVPDILRSPVSEPAGQCCAEAEMLHFRFCAGGCHAQASRALRAEGAVARLKL